jgi:hypothetical protein
MSKFSEPSRSRAIQVARIFLSAALLACILASVFPAAAVASGPMCMLACCEGRAPHAAGSCMNGSCHTGLLERSKNLHLHTENVVSVGHLCGLLRITSANSFSQKISRVQFDGILSQPLRVSPSSFGKSCEPNCGGLCVSGFSNRHRNQAPLTAFNSRRPSLSEISLPSDSRFFRNLVARYRQSVPRGPPSSS